MSITCSSLVKFLFRVKVEGLENEPSEGGAVVCANHISLWDAAIVGAVMNRQVRFFAKKELFSVPVLKHFMKAMGAFPVDRKSPASAALATRHTLSLVSDGEMVGLFPQGTRHAGKNPKDTPIKNGIGQIAFRSDATVIPMCIQTKDWKIGLFKKTYVRIGKPLRHEDFNFGEGSSAEYDRAAHLVFSRITDMIKEPEDK
jgi:1-acyl-sn-glycerol-3-phosphate acyltransferase